jgi:hypothetical protein
MRRIALVLAMVLPLALTSCGDSTGPGGSDRYDLRSIDGDPVPAFTSEGDEVVSGFVRLNGNGTFDASHTFRTTGGTTFTQSFEGTYDRFGDELTLEFDDPDGPGTATIDAVLDGDELVLFSDFEIWIYER